VINVDAFLECMKCRYNSKPGDDSPGLIHLWEEIGVKDEIETSNGFYSCQLSRCISEEIREGLREKGIQI
jgi:hypothetical protein